MHDFAKSLPEQTGAGTSVRKGGTRRSFGVTLGARVREAEVSEAPRPDLPPERQPPHSSHYPARRAWLSLGNRPAAAQKPGQETAPVLRNLRP